MKYPIQVLSFSSPFFPNDFTRVTARDFQEVGQSLGTTNTTREFFAFLVIFHFYTCVFFQL